jgi:chorismate mutase
MDQLTNLRKKIDKIDNDLSKLLEERENLVKAVKKEKRKNDIKILDQKREEEIIEKQNSTFKKNIFKKILEESRKIQKELC